MSKWLKRRKWMVAFLPLATFQFVSKFLPLVFGSQLISAIPVGILYASDICPTILISVFFGQHIGVLAGFLLWFSSLGYYHPYPSLLPVLSLFLS